VDGESKIGDRVAGYRIEGLLGRGGMSIVYRAEDERLGRHVALKLLSPELAENADFRDRFVRESHLAAAIDHPHVIPIYAAGEAEGVLFIAMRLVEGSDLTAILRRGRLDLPQTAAVVSQVAGGLSAAHALDLTHRDVKPGNILIGRGLGPDRSDHSYLCDFGLTKRSLAISGRTPAGGMVGTVAYASPEQIKGQPVTLATDVYSLGCVLYECLAGQPPFVRPFEVAVMWAHVQDQPPALSTVRPDLPRGLDAVVSRAMAKDPAERYGSCPELASAVLREAGLSTPPVLRLFQPVAARAANQRFAEVPPVVQGASAVAAAVSSAANAAPTPAPAAAARAPSAPGRAATGSFGTPSSPSSSQKRRSPVARRRLIGAAVALVFLTATAGVVLATRREQPTGPPPVNTLNRINSGSGRITEVFGVGSRPTNVSAAPNGVLWVINFDDGTLSRVDPSGKEPNKTIGTRGNPTGLAARAEAIWVADGFNGTLLKVDPAQPSIVGEITLTPGLSGVAVGEDGTPWVVNRLDGTLAKIDARSNAVAAKIRVGSGPSGVAVSAGAVWVANELDKSVWRVDPISNIVTNRIALLDNPTEIAGGEGAIWVTSRLASRVSRIDPAVMSVTSTTSVGTAPTGITVGGHSVWVTNSQDGSITEIDAVAKPPRVHRTISVGNSPDGIAVAHGDIWFTLHAV
jgi:YVTN family beta-propeller protein